MLDSLYHLYTFPLLEPLVTLFVYHTSFPLALPYQKSQVYANSSLLFSGYMPIFSPYTTNALTLFFFPFLV